MKALVLYSSSDFPLSALAGSIYLRQLPLEKNCADEFLDLTLAGDYKKYSCGQMCYLGETRQGTRVVAFSCRSGKVMLKNLIETFLDMYGIDTKHCRIVEIKPLGGMQFIIGELLSRLPLARLGGRYLAKIYIDTIYPRLAESVNLTVTSKYQIIKRRNGG